MRRKKYSKTAPLQSDKLADLSAWGETRDDDPRAWRVNGPALIKRDEAGQVKGVNMDLKNPRARLSEDHRSPAEIMDAATAKEREVLAILDELRALVAEPMAA